MAGLRGMGGTAGAGGDAATHLSKETSEQGRAEIKIKTYRSRTSDNDITVPGQAFMNDTRSTCGVGLGDGITNHTAKWHAAGEAEGKTPIEYCQSAEPVRVRGLSVACTGLDGEDAFELGSPVQFISLKGTSRERPAVCKYTGRKWWSDDWRKGG